MKAMVFNDHFFTKTGQSKLFPTSAEVDKMVQAFMESVRERFKLGYKMSDAKETEFTPADRKIIAEYFPALVVIIKEGL
jgi:hypothetical protein